MHKRHRTTRRRTSVSSAFEVRSIRIWGGLALITLMLAAILTLKVLGTHQHLLNSSVVFFPTFSSTAVSDMAVERAARRRGTTYNEELAGRFDVTAQYGDANGHQTITFSSESTPVHLFINNLGGAAPCRELNGYSDRPTTFYYKRLPTDALAEDAPEFMGTQLYLVGIQQDARERDRSITVECNGHWIGDWTTFSTRSLSVTNLGDVNFSGLALRYARPDAYWGSHLRMWFANIDGAENVHFSGGESHLGQPGIDNPEYERDISGPIEVSWSVFRRESERDELLVVIGALIALGASMVVEAFRPYIDRLVARKRQPGRGQSPRATPNVS